MCHCGGNVDRGGSACVGGGGTWEISVLSMSI